jgi:hypothetical protein
VKWRGVRAARAAVLRRQGLHLPAAPRREGVSPVGHSDAVSERRNRPRVSRVDFEFRDRRAKELGAKLIVRTVDEAIAKGHATPAPGEISRNKLQIPVLLGAIEEFQFDCAIGGARRDEEKARAKERFFSFRDSFGQWDPKNQRPEIWNLYNARVNPGENMRVFPLSNWTEMDVWQYIKREQLEVPNDLFQPRARVLPPRRPVAAGAAAAHRPGQSLIRTPARGPSRTSRSRKWSSASAPSPT